jgi:hypothetical protein
MGVNTRLCAITIVGLGITAAACQPTVKIEAPDKPIVIDLNVNIKQEILVKVERDVDELINENPDLF